MTDFERPLEFPCPCEITSHQYSARGLCYGIGMGGKDGRPYGLIVYDNGSSRDVKVLYLDDVYELHLKPN